MVNSVWITSISTISGACSFVAYTHIRCTICCQKRLEALKIKDKTCLNVRELKQCRYNICGYVRIAPVIQSKLLSNLIDKTIIVKFDPMWATFYVKELPLTVFVMMKGI